MKWITLFLLFTSTHFAFGQSKGDGSSDKHGQAKAADFYKISREEIQIYEDQGQVDLDIVVQFSKKSLPDRILRSSVVLVNPYSRSIPVGYHDESGESRIYYIQPRSTWVKSVDTPISLLLLNLTINGSEVDDSSARPVLVTTGSAYRVVGSMDTNDLSLLEIDLSK